MGARVVTVFGGPAFSAAASFDISASTNSPFGSHQGIRSAVADCSDPMIRNFNISQMVVLPVRIELTSQQRRLARFLAHLPRIGQRTAHYFVTAEDRVVQLFARRVVPQISAFFLPLQYCGLAL
jgi:hypothetical protein